MYALRISLSSFCSSICVGLPLSSVSWCSFERSASEAEGWLNVDLSLALESVLAGCENVGCGAVPGPHEKLDVDCVRGAATVAGRRRSFCRASDISASLIAPSRLSLRRFASSDTIEDVVTSGEGGGAKISCTDFVGRNCEAAGVDASCVDSAGTGAGAGAGAAW